MALANWAENFRFNLSLTFEQNLRTFLITLNPFEHLFQKTLSASQHLLVSILKKLLPRPIRISLVPIPHQTSCPRKKPF
jgi:hypothetical protein